MNSKTQAPTARALPPHATEDKAASEGAAASSAAGRRGKSRRAQSQGQENLIRNPLPNHLNYYSRLEEEKRIPD